MANNIEVIQGDMMEYCFAFDDVDLSIVDDVFFSCPVQSIMVYLPYSKTRGGFCLELGSLVTNKFRPAICWYDITARLSNGNYATLIHHGLFTVYEKHNKEIFDELVAVKGEEYKALYRFEGITPDIAESILFKCEGQDYECELEYRGTKYENTEYKRHANWRSPPKESAGGIYELVISEEDIDKMESMTCSYGIFAKTKGHKKRKLIYEGFLTVQDADGKTAVSED